MRAPLRSTPALLLAAAFLGGLASLSPLVLPGPAVAQGAPGGPGGPGGAPRQVGVTTLSRSTVPVRIELPGRAVAFHQTAIRPQVGGEITEIAYRPGESVTTGQVLFRLDDDQRAATLSAAEAAVTSARAAVEGAQATVGRYDRLQGTGVSRAELETAQVALANARASLSAAEAERDMAQLAVDRSDIHSPIDGVADLATVSVGDLVTASQSDALTTVTQLDPIYVDVSESRARFLRHNARRSEGTLDRPEGIEAQLILETGQVYEGAGEMVTPGTTVSATTGTVPFRLQFPNPDRLILPGQFVRVRLTIGTVDGVLVPQRATRRSASGALTAFLVRDGRTVEVTLTEVGTHENAWIVTEGVAAGDALVLDGLTNLRAGVEVTTVPVVIDAEGVVRDAAAEGAAATPEAGTGTGAPAAAGAPDAATPQAGTEAAPAAAGAPEQPAAAAAGTDAAAAAAGAPEQPAATAADAAPAPATADQPAPAAPAAQSAPAASTAARPTARPPATATN
ncbi:efflux RND transporter periplasmic adaptor subunit [Paracoccus sanguinis]|uniref:Membrane fusion protein, multidrug efflux system n=1 Tax=Paracoccus sanguinis TaxID=1545044 RepID=A0A1H3B2T1_9RHOB|nr:efflux RND transporter periplasmic adaptor subunit [Paracoccus sanguinis]SDX36300.1 membrane fusion protein, multidrug efflux system [Paracoccus sanguinis]